MTFYAVWDKTNDFAKRAFAEWASLPIHQVAAYLPSARLVTYMQWIVCKCIMCWICEFVAYIICAEMRDNRTHFRWKKAKKKKTVSKHQQGVVSFRKYFNIIQRLDTWRCSVVMHLSFWRCQIHSPLCIIIMPSPTLARRRGKFAQIYCLFFPFRAQLYHLQVANIQHIGVAKSNSNTSVERINLNRICRADSLLYWRLLIALLSLREHHTSVQCARSIVWEMMSAEISL